MSEPQHIKEGIREWAYIKFMRGEISSEMYRDLVDTIDERPKYVPKPKPEPIDWAKVVHLNPRIIE